MKNEIKNDNDELVKISNKIRSSYPVSKWDKLKIKRFKDLDDRFMLLRLKSGGGVDYTPRPYDGYNH